MSIRLLYGELRTGRITDYLDATACTWSQVANGPGEITGVQVPEHIVREQNLRQAAAAARCFLAVDLDGRLQEAGPIWSRQWDDDAGVLTLGAAGLWSLFDHRYVIPVLAAGQRLQDASITVTNASLGGIAVNLVSRAIAHTGGNLPILRDQPYPPTSGTRSETFPGWKLLKVGDQLRELTAREVDAPDLRFRPRYTADKLGIEWVLEHGTEDNPQLTQVGDDWVFDQRARKSPVVSISTDEDATVMGERAFVTGEGSERGTLIATAYDPTLVDAGWPLMEVEETRSSVSDQGTLDGHAENLRDRSARPIELWTVKVRAGAAVEVQAGDYARVVPRENSAWLGREGEAYMRVKKKAGDLGDNVTMDMYAVAGRL